MKTVREVAEEMQRELERLRRARAHMWEALAEIARQECRGPEGCLPHKLCDSCLAAETLRRQRTEDARQRMEVSHE